MTNDSAKRLEAAYDSVSVAQPHNIPRRTERKLPIPHGFSEAATNYLYLSAPVDFLGFVRKCGPGTTLAVDLETTGLDPHQTRPTLIGISGDGKTVYMLTHEDMQSDYVRGHFNALMERPDIRKVFHNAKFDMRFLMKHYDSKFENFDCTLIMRRLLVCGLDVQSSLDVCAYEYFGYTMDKSTREEFIGNTVITEKMAQYAALDVAATWHLYPILRKYLEIENLAPVYDFIERPLVRVVAEMEQYGVHIDREYLQKLEKMLVEKTEKAQEELDALLRILKVAEPVERKLKRGEATVDQLNRGVTHVREWPSLNVNSSKQVVQALNRVGFELESASAEVLDQPYWTRASLEKAKKISDRDLDDAGVLQIGMDIVERIRDLRAAKKALNAFIEPLQGKFVNPATGRIHSSFNQMGTTTGRFSCSNPNFQQMPSERKNAVFGGLSFRNAFVPAPGMHFIVYDYQACELRILAEMSKDPGLLEAIKAVDPRTGKSDPHTPNAATAYGIKPEEVTKEQRVSIKTCIYTLVYGGGANTVAAALKVPVGQAKQFMDLIFSNFPGITDYIKKRKAFVVQKGYCVSMSGRKRYFDMPRGGGEMVKGVLAGIERRGQNTPIQATNADITKLAMVYVRDRIQKYGARLILSIHDELVVEAPIEVAQEVYEVVGAAMLEAEREFLKVAECAVSGHVGATWEH